MSKEIDSQFPFIQVARDVGAKAAMLAPLLGVSYQHVRGSLDVFWESMADRRYLAGQDAVILSQDEAEARLKMSFGIDVVPDMMVYAGFLEKVDGGYRARGMSRYLDAERSRKAHGNRRRTNPELQSDSSDTPVGLESDSSPTRQGLQSDSTEVRGKRLEVIEKRREVEAVSNFLAQQPTQPRQKSAPSYSSDSLRDRMEAAWLKAIGTSYAWTQEDDLAMRPLLGLGSEAEILSRWKRAVVWTGYPSCSRLKDLVKFWNEYAKEQQPQKASGDRARL